MTYRDRFKHSSFRSFEALFDDKEFQIAFGEKRRTDVQPIVDFLERNVGLEKKSVLDIGAGYGALTVPLAAKCERVIAADSNDYALGAVNFVAQRDSVRNVYTVQIDAFGGKFLPLRDSSMDLVIVNGVLEYAGQGRDSDPIRTQERVLREVHRVLRDSGKLFWAIENRFALTYFTSRGHDGLYFSSLLPRPLANLYSLLVKKQRYQMAEPSFFMAQRLLRAAGFPRMDFFCAVRRSYNHPHAIVSLDRPQDIRQYRKEFSHKYWGQSAVGLVTTLRLQKLFWPNFVIVAAK